jgi:hypothetical protein
MDSPANVAELNKTANSLGKPVKPSVLPEIKLDPGVSSPVSTVIKDKLTEQTLPKLKPTGAKDRIEQNLKDKLNPNTFPQKPNK